MFTMLTARCDDIRPICIDTMLADIVRDVTYIGVIWSCTFLLRLAVCRGTIHALRSCGYTVLQHMSAIVVSVS